MLVVAEGVGDGDVGVGLVGAGVLAGVGLLAVGVLVGAELADGELVAEGALNNELAGEAARTGGALTVIGSVGAGLRWAAGDVDEDAVGGAVTDCPAGRGAAVVAGAAGLPPATPGGRTAYVGPTRYTTAPMMTVAGIAVLVASRMRGSGSGCR